MTTPPWEQTVLEVVHYHMGQYEGDDRDSSLGEDLGRAADWRGSKGLFGREERGWK